MHEKERRCLKRRIGRLRPAKTTGSCQQFRAQADEGLARIVEESQNLQMSIRLKHQDSSDEDVERQKQESEQMEPNICMIFVSCNFTSSSSSKLDLHYDHVATARCNIRVQELSGHD